MIQNENTKKESGGKRQGESGGKRQGVRARNYAKVSINENIISLFFVFSYVCVQASCDRRVATGFVAM